MRVRSIRVLLYIKTWQLYLHFYPLDLDSPGISGVVQQLLKGNTYLVHMLLKIQSMWQNLKCNSTAYKNYSRERERLVA